MKQELVKDRMTVMHEISKMLILGQEPDERTAVKTVGEAQLLLSQLLEKEESPRTELVVESGKAKIGWKSNLLTALCEINDCRALVDAEQVLKFSERAGKMRKHRRASLMKVVGSLDAVHVVKMMYEYLCEFIERDCHDFLSRGDYEGAAKTASDIRKKHMVGWITEALDAKRLEAEEELVAA